MSLQHCSLCFGTQAAIFRYLGTVLQAEVIPTCRELGIAIVPYSPLGRGFLTGSIKSLHNLHESDVRFKISPRFQGENLEKVR